MFRHLATFSLVAAIVAVTGSLPQTIPTASAQTQDQACPSGTEAVALDVIGGEGNQVEKTPSVPSFPVPLPGPIPGITVRNNWNTDWAVPGGRSFAKFVAIVVPEDSENYDIEVNLKYGDDTADEVYDAGSTPLSQGEPLVVQAAPRSNLQPYQVNIQVGDLESVGQGYTAYVIGCQQQAAIATASAGCEPLTVVGGEPEQVSVSKEVSDPGVPGPFGLQIHRNNWNTDWLVPSPPPYQRFVAQIESTDPESENTFTIKMYLKYSDETADEFFNQRDRKIQPGETLEIAAMPRSDAQPYQVNLFVGGVDHVGNEYTATVLGCY